MSFLLGLSQGLTEGILGKQREDKNRFYQQQDNMLNQLHNDAKYIRQEDYPKMMEHIHNLTVAKDDKQLHQAYGKYKSSAITENYNQEQAGQDYNESIPTSQEVPAETITQQATPGNVTGNPKIDSSGVAPPTVTFDAYDSPIPTSQVDALKVRPDAYAGNKIRFRNSEGDQGRLIKVAQAKGDIQSGIAVAKEDARSANRVKEIAAKAKSSGLKGIQYGYDDDGQTVMMGVDNRGNSVKNSLGFVKLPQSFISEMNNKGKREMFDIKTAQEDKQFAATLKISQARIADSQQRTKLLSKELDAQIKGGKFAKNTATATEAKNILSIAELRTGGIDRKYAIAEKEIQDLREQKKYTGDSPKLDAAIEEAHNYMKGLAVERDNITQALEERIAILTNSPVTKEKDTSIKVSGKGEAVLDKNKQPTYKVGNIRQAMRVTEKK